MQNAKWSAFEDKRLMDAVEKHGTQWALVIKEINNTRSLNAIIKRWHGYLKGKSLQRALQANQKNDRGGKEQNQEQQAKGSEKMKETSPRRKREEKQEEQNESEMEDEDNYEIEQENQSEIKKIINDSYDYKINWSPEKDVQLKDLVVKNSIFDWDQLGRYFHTNVEEVKNRWIKEIFPRIKNTHKIGGAVKWSANEDSILYGADKKKTEYVDLMFFLPGRTVYSIEARWRRIQKNLDFIDHMASINNREAQRRKVLWEIAKKNIMERQRKAEEEYLHEKEMIRQQKIESEKYEMMRNPSKIRKMEKYQKN